MESITQAIESSITTAEHTAAGVIKEAATDVTNEAKRVEAAVEGCIEHVYACVCKRLPPMKSDATNTLTQAQKDAEEDAQVIEGAFKRFVRRLWSHV